MGDKLNHRIPTELTCAPRTQSAGAAGRETVQYDRIPGIPRPQHACPNPKEAASSVLTQRQYKTLSRLRTRHARRKTGLFLVEGFRCCGEALSTRPDWVEMLVVSRSFMADHPLEDWLPDATRFRSCLTLVSEAELAELAVTESPQGILCVMRRPQAVLPDNLVDPFTLVLDRIADPGNIGTVLRTAWAVGLTQVWLTKGCADPFSPKAIRSGMGAQFHLDPVMAPDLRETARQLRERGCPSLYLAVPRGGRSCFAEDFDLRHAALVLGNEAHGIDSRVAGIPVSIPMPGKAESLNVSQAATVLLLDAVRRGILG